MPSFDIVCDLDMQEVDNAVNQTQKEIAQRFDFRGGKSSVELDKVQSTIKIVADDELKLRSIHQMLSQKLAKRGVDPRIVKFDDAVPSSGSILKQNASLKAGLEKEEAKAITAAIKESKLKVQAEIQDKQVRVSGKSIDDLQAAIAMLKAKSFEYPLQFINMRR